MKPKYTAYYCLFSILLLFYQTASSQNNNWLYTPNQPSYVRVGDLDISGNKVTVEAVFTRTAPWNGADVFQGDLVSKHLNPTDVNYLLRPSSAEITTTNGYYKTPTICPIELNKTYHAAFVYDGTSLKFYRNGFLMSQMPASGNLIQNDWQTQIGLFYNQQTQEEFVGYIKEVRIWNIARSQSEIQSYMNQPLPSPQTTPGLMAYYNFDNLKNKQGNPVWDGSLGGNAAINNTNPNSSFVADSCNIIPKPKCTDTVKPDFSFNQLICSTKTLQFTTNLENIKTYEWQFGDGQTAAFASPSVTYADFNSYIIKLRVQNGDGCWDSVSKKISVFEQADNALISSNSMQICEGDSVLLQSNQFRLSSCWQPVTGPGNINNNITIVKPAETTTYKYKTYFTGNNLVSNGDFSNGNTGFLSEYQFSSSGLNPGVYNVGAAISSWHPAMTPCKDHTNGSGNMLMVNGADKPNVKVWTQNLKVKPNTNYSFSSWVQTITTINPAKLQFSINGKQLGPIFSANDNSCVWDLFSIMWNSGNESTATIAIVNMNQTYSGNDFAIDDIYFGEVGIRTDSVTVNVTKKPKLTLRMDTAICKGAAVLLNAGVENSANITWTPSQFLDNAHITNPLSKPDSSLTYVAEAVNSGCSAKDSVRITVHENPSIYTINDTTVCAGSSIILSTKANGNYTYNWTPVVGLSSSAEKSPVAVVGSTAKYVVTAATTFGCKAQDSVSVFVKPVPLVNLGKDTLICEGKKLLLNAQNEGATFIWNDGSTLQTYNTSHAGLYTVSVTKNGCQAKDSINVLTKAKPIFKINPLDTSLCNGSSVQLTASGGDTYHWYKDNVLLNEKDSQLILQPSSSANYKVQVYEKICSYTDTLASSIHIKPLPVISISKSNDIDCNKPGTRLIATGGSLYEWSKVAGINNMNIPDPVVTPKEDTWYKVKVTGINGCSAEDSIKVLAHFTGKGSFFIPNAFTPNGDGKNDCFGVRYWSNTVYFSLQIYNRWGEAVFKTKNVTDCWNGIYKGQAQPQGTYVYYIKAKTPCGDVEEKGTLILTR